MEIKPGRRIFFPTNDLRQTADAIQSLLNNTIGEDNQPIAIPTYCTRDYILELIASIINGLINQGEQARQRADFEARIRSQQ